MDTRDSSGVRLEFCLRSLLPPGAAPQQERVIQRLEALEAAGRIDSFDIVLWGGRLGVSTAAARTETGREIHDRIDACIEWAAANGRTFRSCFEAVEYDQTITGESYTAIELPQMTLIEYADDEIRHVAPCTDGTTVYDVSDRLDALEAAGEPPTEVDDREFEVGDEPPTEVADRESLTEVAPR